MVMSPDRGGVFDVLLGLARRGLGGPIAGGRQYVSWIHERDFVRAVLWLLDAATTSQGPVNLAAPNPLPQRDFMRRFALRWGPLGLPATSGCPEIGAFVLRTDTELLLKSRRVVPGRLLAAGFRLRLPDLAGGGGGARATVAALSHQNENPIPPATWWVSRSMSVSTDTPAMSSLACASYEVKRYWMKSPTELVTRKRRPACRSSPTSAARRSSRSRRPA